MRERDDLELFIHQLEAALIASDIPRHKWKRYIHSQLTPESKQKVIHLLQDVASSYDDIKAALMGCSAMSFAATAEAIFSSIGGEGEKPKPRQLANRIRRWVDKLFQEAETVEEAAEKVSVAYIRSKLIPEVKNYMDLTEANTMPRFLMNGNVLTNTKEQFTNMKGCMDQTVTSDKDNRGSFQTGVRKNVTYVFTVANQVTCPVTAEQDFQVTAVPSKQLLWPHLQ